MSEPKTEDKDIGAFLSDLAKHIEESKKTIKLAFEIEFPITVKEIVCRTDHPVRMQSDGHKSGQFVAVRSVKKEHGEKTYLGILVGFVPIDVLVSLKHPEGNPKEGTLAVSSRSTNPLIFIPELGESVLGAESWWEPIKDETQLRQITNEDIQNVWYVKALKQLSEAKKAEEKKES